MAVLPRPLRIEFFGLPGSGKTTVARMLHRELLEGGEAVLFSPALTRDDVAAIPRTAARLAMIGRDLPRHRDELDAVRAVAALPQATLRDRAKAIFNLLTVLSLYRRIARSGASAVVDQGLLQAAWTAHLRGRSAAAGAVLEPWAALLARHAAGRLVFVSVETPVAVCVERLETRKGRHSRLQSGPLLHDPEVWSEAEALRHRLTSLLTRVLATQGAMDRLIVVDGSADPGETAAKLARRLCRNRDLAVGDGPAPTEGPRAVQRVLATAR
jgi:hypothetical protein